MALERIPLVGSLINRNTNVVSFANYDQRFENCYPEVTQNPVTGQAKVYCYKRPGFIANNVPGASYVGQSGTLYWAGAATPKLLFNWRNGTTMQVFDTSGTQYGGDLAGTSGSCSISETSISGTSYIIVIVTRTSDNLPNAYWVTDGGGAFTRINDVDFPPNLGTPRTLTGPAVALDGYVFVMDTTSRIYNSDLNSITSWTSTGYIDAQEYPDKGVALARMNNMIVAFCGQSIQFFQNAGNATGSPLSRVVGATKRIGGYANPLNVGDFLYFLGVEDNSVNVYRMSGTTPQRISSPAIEKYLDATIAAGSSFFIAGTMNLHGMDHVVIGSRSATSICYCIQTGIWWYLKCGNDLDIRACNVAGAGTYFVTATNGASQGRKLFALDPANPVFQDDGVTYTMTVQTAPIDHGSRKRKFYQSFEVVGDIRSTSGNTGISFTDDDYQTFSTERNVDMSTGRPRLTRLGSARRRAWKITDAVNAPFRAEAIDIDVTVGAN
jgi:hypothetical protein